MADGVTPDRAVDRADAGSPAALAACPNGPLLVRGDVELRLANGDRVPRRRRTIALCRCGASAIKPFCDGSHKLTGFTTDDGHVDAEG